MHRPLTLVGAALLILAFGHSVSAQDAKMIERGKQVYAEQKCKMCHSIGTEGNTKGPLDDTGNKLKAAEIKEWIVDPDAAAKKHNSTKKPAMPKTFAKLPPADVDALVAYLQTLK